MIHGQTVPYGSGTRGIPSGFEVPMLGSFSLFDLTCPHAIVQIGQDRS